MIIRYHIDITMEKAKERGPRCYWHLLDLSNRCTDELQSTSAVRVDVPDRDNQLSVEPSSPISVRPSTPKKHRLEFYAPWSKQFSWLEYLRDDGISKYKSNKIII